MNVARLLIVATFGALISYYISTIFCSAIITGTSTGDNLITALFPISLAAVAVVVILSVGFGKQILSD